MTLINKKIAFSSLFLFLLLGLLKGQIPLVVVACGSLLWGGWDGPGGPAVETPGVAPSPEAPIKRRGTALAAL